MFEVGQKVVCIGSIAVLYPQFKYPEDGQIYRIRDIYEWKCYTGLLLEEVVNPSTNNWDDGPGEICWASIFFRPIDYSYGTQICESLEVMTEPELV